MSSFRDNAKVVRENLDEASSKEITISAGIGFAVVVGLLVAGILFGWFALGWGLAPVQWEPQSMNDMPEASKEIVIETVSELYALTGDVSKVDPYTYELYNLDGIACKMANEELSRTEPNYIRYARLVNIAFIVNGYGCN